MLVNYKNWRKCFFVIKKKKERKADKTSGHRSKAYIQLHKGYYTMLHGYVLTKKIYIYYINNDHINFWRQRFDYLCSCVI